MAGKSEIVTYMFEECKQLGIEKNTKALASAYYDAFWNAIVSHLKDEGVVTCMKYVTFRTADKPAYISRNPSTQEEVQVPASIRVVAKIAPALKALINEKK